MLSMSLDWLCSRWLCSRWRALDVQGTEAFGLLVRLLVSFAVDSR